MVKARIYGIRYVTGEQLVPFSQAASFRDVLFDRSIPDDPEMMGWGVFHRTTSGVMEMAIDAGNKTLRDTKSRSSVDAVIFCCTNFGDMPNPERVYRNILCGLELESASIFGITLNECTSLISAIELARGLIGLGTYRRILVISSDMVENEKYRFTDSALYSDAAVAFLLGDGGCDDDEGVEIVGADLSARATSIGSSSVFSDMELYESSYDRLLARAGWPAESLSKVFVNNLYLPIINIKEAVSGICPEQLYTNNIPRMGHCFSADPLINLAVYLAENGDNSGSRFALSANSEGLRATMLVTR